MPHPTEILDESAQDVLDDAHKTVFTCACWLCDNRVDDVEEAVRDGWRHITYDDGPSWNFTGECPVCGGGGQQRMF